MATVSQPSEKTVQAENIHRDTKELSKGAQGDSVKSKSIACEVTPKSLANTNQSATAAPMPQHLGARPKEPTAAGRTRLSSSSDNEVVDCDGQSQRWFASENITIEKKMPQVNEAKKSSGGAKTKKTPVPPTVISKAIAKGNSKENQVRDTNRHSQDTNVLKNPNRPKLTKASSVPSLNAPNIRLPLDPSWGDHRIVCSACFKPNRSDIVTMSHDCLEDRLAVKGKGTGIWVEIRERSNHRAFLGKYTICKNNSKYCWMGCSYAHNTAEQALWTQEKDGRFLIATFIANNRKTKSSLHSLKSLFSRYSSTVCRP